MAELIATYRTTPLGIDSQLGRLLDESGNGNHLPLVTGAPAFATYDGVTAWSVTGAAYFGGPNLLAPPLHTAILVLHPKLAGDAIRILWAGARQYANADIPHDTPTTPFETDGQFSPAQTIHTRYVQVGGDAIIVGSPQFNTSTPGFVSNSWVVVTYVSSGETAKIRARIGTGAWGSADTANHLRTPFLEEMRVGYRPTPIATDPAVHLGCARVEIYAGDYTVDDPTGCAARVAALIAKPDL